MLIRNVRLRLGRVLGASLALLLFAALVGAAVTFSLLHGENQRLRSELQASQRATSIAKHDFKVEPALERPDPSKQATETEVAVRQSRSSTKDFRELRELLEYKRRLKSGEPRGKILFEMAKLYHSLGAVEEAIKRLEECSDNDEPISGTADFYCEFGQAKSNVADIFDASSHFFEVQDIDPRNSKGERASAKLKLKTGDIDQAQELIHSALKKDPLEPLNHHVNGLIQQSLLQFNEAEVSFNKALSLLQTKDFAKKRALRLDLAELYALQGFHSKSESKINLVLSNDPEHSRALFLKGRLALAMGNASLAQRSLEKALHSEELWHQRLAGLEKYDLAEPLPHNAKKNSLLFQKRSHRARILALLALLDARKENKASSEHFASRALQFYSRQAIALPILKRSIVKSGEVHKLLLEDHGLYFNQASTAYFFGEATKLIEQGKESKTRAPFEAALRALKIVQWRIPTHGLAKTKEALCHAYLGRMVTALDAARMASFLTPKQADAFELQARLHSRQFIPINKESHSTVTKNRQLALNSLITMRKCGKGAWVETRAYTLEAAIYLDASKAEQALKALKTARLRIPELKTPKAFNTLDQILKLQAKIYTAMGDHSNAKLAKGLLLKHNMKRAKLRDAHYEAGQTLFSNRKYNKAIDEYKRANEYNALRGQIHYDLGLAYMKIGNFIPGVLSTMTALELDPSFAHLVAMKLRPNGCHFPNLQRVLDELTKVVKAYPKRPTVYALRAYFYCFYATQFNKEKLSGNSVDAGLADTEQALRLNPSFHFARLVRADLLSFSGRFDEASLEYTRAMRAVPNWDTALSSQAIHYYRMAAKSSGSKAKAFREEALKNLNRCVELGFKDFRWRQDPIMKTIRDNDDYNALLRSIPE